MKPIFHILNQLSKEGKMFLIGQANEDSDNIMIVTEDKQSFIGFNDNHEMEIVLMPNQRLEEHSGMNVVLTFKHDNAMFITKEEIDEINEQIANEIYGGSVNPEIHWKAWIIK